MLPENKIRGFVIKVLLCSLGLFLGGLILAPKAHLQNNTAVANAVPNTRPTPRARKNVNAAANAIANIKTAIREIDPTLEPPPTPLPATSTIRGRVFYSDTGRAVKRGSIMLMNENVDDGPGSSPSAITDALGYFQMKNVRAGTYYAVINAPGVVSPLAFFDFSSARNRGSEKEAFATAFTHFEKIVVDGITPIDIEVPAYRGGAIGGRVMYDDGDPAIGVRIEIMRKVGDKFMSVIPNFSAILSMRMGGAFQTDDRGVYRFAGLPPGEYIVKVTESVAHGNFGERTYYDPFMGPVSNSFLTIFYPDGYDTKTAKLIEVGAGQEIGEINLIIPSRGLFKLEGKTVAAKDKSPVKSKIIITRETEDNTFSVLTDMGNRGEQSTVTDEEGNWKFKELPKGNYLIVIEPVQTDRDYQAIIGNYRNANVPLSNAEYAAAMKPKLAKKAQVITVDDKDVLDVVVELGYGATISGTVAVENSREMPKSVTVRTGNETDRLIVAESVNNYYYGEAARPQNPTHDFKLENVTIGKNRLYVEIDEDDYYVKSATVNGIDLLASPLEVKEGDILRNVQIVLSKGVGTLKGTVTDAQNKAVVGAEFSLVPVDVARRRNTSLYRRARTDRNGEFEIKMAPGEYAIVIFGESISDTDAFLKWLDTAVKDAQKVRIETGKTETVSIKNFK